MRVSSKFSRQSEKEHKSQQLYYLTRDTRTLYTERKSDSSAYTLMQALRLMTLIYLNVPLRALYLKTDVKLLNELYADLRNFNLP